MRFKDVFSIIGPSMVGPSSSHTAGAVRIGLAARRIFGGLPERAELTFYGSFAETYRGHGTDLAVVAGLLDFPTDDLRIRNSLAIAEELGVGLAFRTGSHASYHPNTVMIRLEGGGRADVVVGSSIGGGSVEINAVNDFDVKFTMNYPTLLVFHDDRPGMLAQFTNILGEKGVNIGYMDVDRKGRSKDALTVMETDEAVSAELRERIGALPDVRRVCLADLTA